MKVILPSVEIMRTGLETEVTTPEQFIEKVGRTCYKSEDKITDDSAVKFVGNLIKRGHEAMIEHWNLIYRFASLGEYVDFQESKLSIEDITGIHFHLRLTDREDDGGNRYTYVSGNMRAWRDYIKAWVGETGFIPAALCTPIQDYPTFFPEYQERAKYITNRTLIPVTVNDLEPEERLVHQNVTVKFICDRGVSHEIVRHRAASFAQESTRYCNYILDKFGSELTVIVPYFLGGRDDGRIPEDRVYTAWENSCKKAEEDYFNLLKLGCTPQEARSVLPSSLKTEVIVTMNLDGWAHFFNLRCAHTAHPDMQEVAKMAKRLFDQELPTTV